MYIKLCNDSRVIYESEVLQALGLSLGTASIATVVSLVLGIPLAALGMLNPVIAGAAMAFSSVSVVANALTLRRWQGAADAPVAPRLEPSQPVAVSGSIT